MAFALESVSTMFGRSWWDVYDFPARILDQHFGNGLLESDMYAPSLQHGFCLRPRTQATIQASGESVVKNGKDKFQVTLDVSQFAHAEIDVKIIDRYIVVHGKHEEKSDEHGFVQREFTRRYMLPGGTKPETTDSFWDKNGCLVIESPKMVGTPPSDELVVRIKEYEPSSEDDKQADPQ